MRREDFIPDVVWIRGDDGWMLPVNRADNPEKWRELASGDDAVAIQVDDGTDSYNGKGVVPTSSSSARWVMKKMFDLLDVRAGMDILEIGTGTGYNAALLATRAAPGRVTTVEVDEGIAEHARTVLARTGFPVAVVTGDGTAGHLKNAPYDRVVATAAALAVPYAWVEQTRPAGRIVLPLEGSFCSGTLVCLVVREDGTAQGGVHDPVGFMRLRNQRDDEALWRVWSRESAAHFDGDPDGDLRVETTRKYHPEPFTDLDAGFAVSARLPGWVTGRREVDGVLLMSHAPSGSWAVVIPGEKEHRVYHEGPRRLWEELEAAYQWWVEAGRPDHTRFGMTVTREGQEFWLDSPDQIVSSMERQHET